MAVHHIMGRDVIQRVEGLQLAAEPHPCHAGCPENPTVALWPAVIGMCR
eukprot:CAMPEP_0179142782 /NCGR_PEP_ID=MMETSP0796-20121207/68611_1 /TAXON_ID=73915 /ORGANISM="Pyrodinium bahamense, Strain pbaha01" /LENGTH=48 /DNA_ID= /DNA_START= /DNA_END= /DNA_ORIENTATION=